MTRRPPPGRMTRMPGPTADPSNPSTEDHLRQHYLEHLDTLEQTYRDLHEALDNAAGAVKVVGAHLRRGGRARDFAGLIDPAPLRRSMADAMTTFERNRHQGQKHFFRLLIAEGMTMADIARAWGISRQLVSRLVNEPD